MFLIKKNNKERVVDEINENKLENVFNIIPNLSDKVLDYNEEKYNITNMTMTAKAKKIKIWLNSCELI